MLPTPERPEQYDLPPVEETDELSDIELEEGAMLLVDALTLPPPPVVVVRD
ncbi:hypothetical protein ACFFP0_10950 [Rhizobium puerariae]|uniref:Uncharacterized protein n=1 Tax=Rhizobium puerariae TaxID=1585791 RepID=A0ABV6AFL8_9HYPH